MFLKFLSNEKYLKPLFAKKPSSFLVTWIPGMFFMCLLIMSLKVIKVSSNTTAHYDKQTAAFTKEDNLHSFKITLNNLQHSDMNKTSALIGNLKDKINTNLNRTESTLMENHALFEEMEKNVSKARLRANVDENAFLLERENGASFAGSTFKNEEKPIYGTWRTRVRSVQLPIMPTTSRAMSVNHEITTDNHTKQNFQQQNAHERLPRRMSTVWPMSRDLTDQIPRPPRLTSRPSSFVIRRNFEVPFNNSVNGELSPKPFHFPFDGPMPEKFKKVEAERTDVNNIQDILQHLHLTGVQQSVPPMMMLPTGLHISGSFKNLKSSGIQNFFGNKRNKKHVQQQKPKIIPIPMALPLYGPFQPQGIYDGLQTPHQRIAMDQFYPFKPRSPNDINLLAMHQQLKSKRVKNKKKTKKLLAINNNHNNNLLLQHSNSQVPFAVEPYASFYPQLFAFNVTQKPKHKRLPFNLNLDIYPVMPPVRDTKTSPYIFDESKITISTRPPTILRNPIGAYTPTSTAYAYARQYDRPLYNAIQMPQIIQQNPQASNMHNNYQASQQQHYYPNHQQKLQQQQQQHYQQQQQQQQQYKQQNSKQAQALLHSHSQEHLNAQVPLLPTECTQISSSNNIQQHLQTNSQQQANPIMVHLNVFPKSQKLSQSASTPILSTNPFYNDDSGGEISRNKIYDEVNLNQASSAQMRMTNQNNLQRAQTSQISRSDEEEQYIDFEHPIIAAEIITDLPQSEKNISNTPENMHQFMDKKSKKQNNQQHNNNNYNNNINNIEQMASEAHAASLFRFPVENLIQFQLDDAL